jgi:biopolymer transport protein ExbD
MSLWVHAPQRADVHLNLIPLIDVMSVMVAFLLIYSADVEVVQNTKGIEIPQSSAEAEPQHSVVVMITRDHLFVQGEPVGTTAEIGGTDASQFEPLRRVLNRPMIVGDAIEDDAAMAAREITVIADKSLPFDIVKKVMATCTGAAYGKISLAVLQKEQLADAST